MTKLEIKKSVFIGMAFDIEDKNSVKVILVSIYLEHKKANHVCYAFISKSGAEAGMSDDGEPRGTAGKPLMGLLNIKKQQGKLLVVVRYYGGKKLGASNLLRAYINAAKNEI